MTGAHVHSFEMAHHVALLLLFLTFALIKLFSLHKNHERQEHHYYFVMIMPWTFGIYNWLVCFCDTK